MKPGPSQKAFVGCLDTLCLAMAALLVGVNAGLLLAGWWLGLILGLSAAIGTAYGYRRAPWAGYPLDRREGLYLLSGSLIAGGYCLSWYWKTVPHDFWLDFPQQSLLYHWGLPLSHPYLPDLHTEGQYGRNLLVAALARLTPASVLPVSILSNVVIQVALFLQVYLCFKKQSTAAAVYASLLAFLGLGVGGWCGLLDHFFHHAALAHLLVFLCWRGWQNSSPLSLCPLLALGLVFPLYLMLLLPVWLLFSKDPRRDLGLAALLLGLCLLQGGPLRQLLPGNRSKDTAAASQKQHFQLGFPKSELLKISLEPWSYWRVSSGLTSTVAPGLRHQHFQRGYASIFGLEVLKMHWFPVWLAPLTLFLLPKEQRPWWFFAALAYLVPGLVNFGPVYESEYYRWQLAAGVGFGVCLASVLSRHRAGVLLVVLCCLPGVERLATHSWQLGWPSRNVWLQRHSQDLRLRPGELAVCAELARRAEKGDQVWRDNLPDLDDNKSILGDAVVVGLTGLRVTGHALPVVGDFIGRPPFRPSLNARALWLLDEPAAPRGAGVRWLICRSSRDLSFVARRVFQADDVALWELDSQPTAASDVAAAKEEGQMPSRLRVFANQVLLYSQWCPAFSGTLQATWTSGDGNYRSYPVFQSTHGGLVVSAPPLPGSYTLDLSSGHQLEVEVLPTATLEQVTAGRQAAAGGQFVYLENRAGGELRLHDVSFTLSSDSSAQVSGPQHFQEIFVVRAGARVRIPLPAAGSAAFLKIEAREGSRMVPLE